MKLKQLFAMLLCAALLVCCAPIALAAEDTATVTFCYSDGSEMQTFLDLTVADGTAEKYGYDVAKADHTGAAIETVTAMDVLVAVHAAVYGDAFTAETAGDYLVADNSYMTKVFGVSSSYLGFTVNDATPHDDTYVEAYYGYTGYAIDTARVQDGDRINLFAIHDPGWMEIIPLFKETTINAEADKAFTVSVSGYSVMRYGYSTQEVIDQNTYPLAGVTVEKTQDFKTFEPVGTLDENGELSVTLPETGTYYLVVRGTYKNNESETPVIASFCKVDVQEAADTSKAEYVPFGVNLDIRFEDFMLTFTLIVKFRDLHKTAPDKTETFSYTLSLACFKQFFQK